MGRPPGAEREVPRPRARRQRAAEMRLLGVILIASGLILLFLCVPGWAWAALVGSALVVLGWLLVK